VKPSFFLAFLATTGVLTTAVTAQEGGDSTVQQFCRPLVFSDMPQVVDVTPVSDVNQCPGDPSNPNPCTTHCTVDISGTRLGERAPELILRDALRRCNTTVRLGPNANLDYSHKFKNPTPEDPNKEEDLRPLRFGQCVTLTSVKDFHHPISTQARTPQSLARNFAMGTLR